MSHLKIPQYASKLGESIYGKTPCEHLNSPDLQQESGSRLSLSEKQPLMMGVPEENTFVLGCMNCAIIMLLSRCTWQTYSSAQLTFSQQQGISGGRQILCNVHPAGRASSTIPFSNHCPLPSIWWRGIAARNSRSKGTYTCTKIHKSHKALL